MKILKTETRQFGGVWETKFVIETDDGKIEEEWVNSPQEPKTLIELEKIAIGRLQAKVESPVIEIAITDITLRYTPKELFDKLSKMKDISKVTWVEVDK